MINVGIIGYGYWGPNLVRNFAELAGCKVAAIADLDPEKLALAQRRFPAARTTTDVNDLIADPAKTNKNYRMIFIGAGTEDTAVNGGRTMHDTLTKAGVKHIWSEDPGYGHDYQIWRQYFHRLMQQTFRD